MLEGAAGAYRFALTTIKNRRQHSIRTACKALAERKTRHAPYRQRCNPQGSLRCLKNLLGNWRLCWPPASHAAWIDSISIFPCQNLEPW